MIRLFAALSPPSDVRGRLLSVQSGLDGWRLSPPENFHVTLSFFGEVEEAQAADLHSALSDIEAPGFDIWIDGVNVFGGDKPRLAYAAVRPDPALSHLRDKVRQAGRVAGLDLPAERYVPHVTLGRGGARADARLARWLEGNGAFLAGPIRVGAFHLYRSDLGRAAPTYTQLATYTLTSP